MGLRERGYLAGRILGVATLDFFGLQPSEIDVVARRREVFGSPASAVARGGDQIDLEFGLWKDDSAHVPTLGDDPGIQDQMPLQPHHLIPHRSDQHHIGHVAADFGGSDEIGDIPFVHQDPHRLGIQDESDIRLGGWKGLASYFDVVVGEATNPNSAWHYLEPLDEAKQSADYVAFWKGVKVES